MSAGGTIVLGDSAKQIEKMLNTLYMFTADAQRWCTLSTAALGRALYWPGVRLQPCLTVRCYMHVFAQQPQL